MPSVNHCPESQIDGPVLQFNILQRVRAGAFPTHLLRMAEPQSGHDPVEWLDCPSPHPLKKESDHETSS